MVLDTNGMPIVCSAASGEVFEAGFEVIRNSLQKVTLLSPLGGEKFAVGQIMPIAFRNDTVSLSQVYLKLSVDNGRNYHNFSGSYGINRSSFGTSWGTFNWTIPESLDIEGGGRISTISARCKIRIEPYQAGPEEFDISDSAFTIAASTPVAGQARRECALEGITASSAGSRVTIWAAARGAFRVDVFAISGKRMVSFYGAGQRCFMLPTSLSGNVGIVRMKTAAGQSTVLPVAAQLR
jgi:hypothetical protein